MTMIDWPLFLDFAKRNRPTKDIDNSNHKYSPPGAWESAVKSMFHSDPGTYRLMFLIETDYPLPLFERQLPMKCAGNGLALVEGSIQEIVTALPRVLSENADKDTREIGMELYALLYQNAREFVKDFKKQDAGDGTWYIK
jgi:hypothetical protein